MVVSDGGLSGDERVLRQLVDSIGEAVIATDLAGTVWFWNAAAERLHGRRADEVVGRSALEIFRPDLADADQVRVLAEVTGGRVWAGRMTMHRDDGTAFPAAVTAAPITADDGGLTGIVAVFADLTERVAEQARLAELAAIVASSDAAIIGLTADGVVRSWNPAAERLFGHHETDATGRALVDLVGAADRCAWVDILAAARAGGPVDERRIAAADRGGRTVVVAASVSAVRDDAGTVCGLAALVRDVSAELAMEESVRASERRFRALVQRSSDVAMIFDADGIVRYVSPGCATLFGYEADEIVGTQGWRHVHPDDLAVERERVTAALAEQGSVTVEWRLRTAFGWRWFEETIADLTDDASVNGFIGNLRDVTGRKETEAAHQASEERFRRLFEESPVGKSVVDRTLHIVEVNTALARLLGYRRDELRGRSISEITHPDDVDADVTRAARLFAGEIDHYRLDKRYVRADGAVIICRVTVTALDDGDERLAIRVVEDVTERVQAEHDLAERDERLRMALDAAAMVTFDLGLVDGTLAVSDNIVTAWNLDRARLDGTFASFLDLVHPGDVAALQPDVLVERAAHESLVVADYRIRGVGGTLRWVHARGRPIFDGDGRPVRIIGTGMDVTAQREAEERRAESELVLRRTIDASPDAFVGADEHGRITDWNAAAEVVFGWRADEVLGRNLADTIVPESHRGAHRRAFTRAAAEGAMPRWQRELVAMHRTGRVFPAEISMVSVRGEMGLRFEAFVRDITQRKQIEEQLTRQALADPLTGLPNRVLLRDRLVHAIARLRRRPGQLSVLFLDLDRFKFVNDSVGHAEGDELLRVVAARLDGVVRASDTVARFGGDEFVVLLESPRSTDHVIELAERILGVLAAPVLIAGHEVRPTASLGVSVTSDPTASPDDLIRDADAAMYRAKERGGNCWEVFDPVMRRRALARLEMETQLRHAIDGDELELHYQPVWTTDGKVHAVEALVRWSHPSRGLVQPADFIPLAEETGLVVPLGNWVIRRAVAQVARWRATVAPDLHLSVNMSSRQLGTPDLLDTVTAALSEGGVDPSAVYLELTESALMEDATAATSTLTALHDIGVRIAVDDFGTGYSSLLYLRRFPVSVLKLDRFFVAGLGRHAEDDVIVGSAIDLAHSLKLAAVAEGVETEDQVRILRELGCDLFQGYFFARPLTVADLEALLRGHMRHSVHHDVGALSRLAAVTGDVAAPSVVHRVVLVDDSSATRALLLANLNRAGDFVVVGEAGDGDEALAVVADRQPDLVLLDLAMPGRDGFDILADLIAVAPRSRVVVLSGFTSEGISETTTNAGAVACIDKSISPEGLIETLRGVAPTSVHQRVGR